MNYNVTIKTALLEALVYTERLDLKDCELSVTYVSSEKMRSMNNSFRGKNNPTDVLSFPAAPNALIIGDIAICLDVAKSQAEEYGHSLERELAFLTVHGFLHLLGYNHENPEDEKKMNNAQENILNKAGIPR